MTLNNATQGHVMVLFNYITLCGKDIDFITDSFCVFYIIDIIIIIIILYFNYVYSCTTFTVNKNK